MITKEAIEAAAKELLAHGEFGTSDGDNRRNAVVAAEAAITAAFAAMPGPAVKVKPLEWEDTDEGMCTKWRAAALGGHYELVALDGDDGGLAVNFHWGRPLSFWFIQADPDEWGPTGPRIFPTLDEAKAAAQADYERRFLSSLTPAPDPQAENETLRAALLECAEYFDNRADADCDQDGYIPNDEMKMLTVVRAALERT